MERPVYANAFSISYNPQANEVVVTLMQEYPNVDVDKMAKADPGMEPIQSVRESVGSFVLPQSIAMKLKDVLGEVLKAPGQDKA